MLFFPCLSFAFGSPLRISVHFPPTCSYLSLFFLLVFSYHLFSPLPFPPPLSFFSLFSSSNSSLPYALASTAPFVASFLAFFYPREVEQLSSGRAHREMRVPQAKRRRTCRHDPPDSGTHGGALWFVGLHEVTAVADRDRLQGDGGAAGPPPRNRLYLFGGRGHPMRLRPVGASVL